MARTLLILTAIFSFACSHEPPPAARDDAPARSAAPGSVSTITLVGCLRGPATLTGTGTAGATPAATATDAPATTRAAGARFTLVIARIESADANGRVESGASFAPGSTVELDEVADTAKASINKQVRVVGRIADPQAVAASDTASSPRDDVRANGTTVAGDTRNSRVTVDTVQPVAESCTVR